METFSGEAYIVLGHSRTGTSLTTGLLGAMGVHIGNHFAHECGHRGGGFNPCYYEDRWLHDFIVDKLRTPQEVLGRLATKPKWGMKLPQLAEHWEHFKDLIEDPRFVVTHRDLSAVVLSVKASTGGNWKPEEKIRKSYVGKMERIDIISNGKPRIDIQFEAWFQSPGNMEQLDRLAEFAGVKVTQEARDLIDPKLKHF